MKETHAKIPDVTHDTAILRKALEFAAEDFYRGCNLYSGQRADLLQEVIDNWLARANGSNIK